MKIKHYARIVFGVLVVEDIVVMLLMVLLSTIAVTKQFAGTEILYTISKLVFFLALWFIAGIFLLPTLLKKAKSLIDEETLLILHWSLPRDGRLGNTGRIFCRVRCVHHGINYC